jgi:hypothetical protein
MGLLCYLINQDGLYIYIYIYIYIVVVFKFSLIFDKLMYSNYEVDVPQKVARSAGDHVSRNINHYFESSSHLLCGHVKKKKKKL